MKSSWLRDMKPVITVCRGSRNSVSYRIDYDSPWFGKDFWLGHSRFDVLRTMARVERRRAVDATLGAL